MSLDVEKTIQFLIERSAEHDARIATIEELLLRVAEQQDRFTADLKKTNERTEKTNQRLAEMDKKRIAMGKDLDRRIGALVSAIGKLSEIAQRRN